MADGPYIEEASSSCLTIRLPEFATWIGIERETAAEMAESGAIPGRVGHKGLEFDPLEVYRWGTRARPVDRLALSGETTLRMARSFAATQEVGDLYGIALAYAMELTQARWGSVFVSDAEAWLEPLLVAGPDDSRRTAALGSIAAWVGVNRRVVCVGLPLNGAAVHSDERWRSVVGLPVVVGGGLHGVMVLDTDRSNGVLGPDHLAGAEAIATQLAIAIALCLARGGGDAVSSLSGKGAEGRARR